MKYLLPALCVGLAISLTAANAATAEKPRSAKSIECSKLADAKGLHGKERQVFRKKCKKGET